MKRISIYSLFLLSVIFWGCNTTQVFAQTSVKGNGHVTVKPSEVTPPKDPENPEKPIDPGEVPSTKGFLRLDYVPALNFGKVNKNVKNREYFALAQNVKEDIGPRANFIQITDTREKSSGWTLQVKQNYQFRSEDSTSELGGSILSFDKGWASSAGDSKPPIVARDTISIENIDQAYTVATAESGAGRGTWSISFGASDKNGKGQENTLVPVLDDQKNPIQDPEFNKPLYRNSAVSIKIPHQIEILATPYHTEITWILAELP